MGSVKKHSKGVESYRKEGGLTVDEAFAGLED